VKRKVGKRLPWNGFIGYGVSGKRSGEVNGLVCFPMRKQKNWQSSTVSNWLDQHRPDEFAIALEQVGCTVCSFAQRAFKLDKLSLARVRFSRTYQTKGAKGETSP